MLSLLKNFFEWVCVCLNSIDGYACTMTGEDWNEMNAINEIYESKRKQHDLG